MEVNYENKSDSMKEIEKHFFKCDEFIYDVKGNIKTFQFYLTFVRTLMEKTIFFFITKSWWRFDKMEACKHWLYHHKFITFGLLCFSIFFICLKSSKCLQYLMQKMHYNITIYTYGFTIYIYIERERESVYLQYQPIWLGRLLNIPTATLLRSKTILLRVSWIWH